MSNNTNLHTSRIIKNDEYYTTTDIVEQAILPYQEYLIGKKILYPCDSESSNFVIHLKELGYNVEHYHKENVEQFEYIDGTDIINIDKVKEIPKNYNGIMAVPISYIVKYNHKQFNIVGILKHGCDSKYDLCKPCVNGKEKFTRLLIRTPKGVH